VPQVVLWTVVVPVDPDWLPLDVVPDVDDDVVDDADMELEPVGIRGSSLVAPPHATCAAMAPDTRIRVTALRPFIGKYGSKAGARPFPGDFAAI
jgi:hypothetical protein